MTMAAALYVPLVADWCVPGSGLHEAVQALGGVPGVAHPPLWVWLVRLVGRDVMGLGTISMFEALLCTALLLVLAEDLVTYAVRLAQKRVTRTDASFAGVKVAAIVLTGAAFVLTPGFLRAATRIGPLMSLLLLLLAAVTLVVRVVTTVRDDERMIDRLKRGGLSLLSALVLFGFLSWEVVHLRHLLLDEGLSFVLFILFGLFPLLAFCDLTRRWLLLTRRRRLWFFGGWTLAVVILGTVAFLSYGSGRVAERVARMIVRQAAGCHAVVSDGALDDVLFFLLPEGQRLVSTSRDFDPAYGRELSDWLRKEGYSTDSDLVFAAELGPRAFVSEWRKCQNPVDATSSSRRNKEGAVLYDTTRRDVASTGRVGSDGVLACGRDVSLLTPETYFPTVEAWREGVAALDDMRGSEPLGAYLRRLLGACGNHLACQRLEKGDREAAWQIFWEVLNRVDGKNYTVLVNLSGMVERGYDGAKKDLESLKQLRDAVERDLQTPKRRQFAALSGGRLYVDPKVREQQETARKKALEEDRISPQVRAFVETVPAAPKDEESARRAREAIRKGINQGLVRTDRIGDQLITLDRVLEDWESAERDSISVLRLERRHVAANSMMGMLAGSRGDYPRAERYLRRAVTSVAWNGSESALNDLAFTLTQLGRYDEAVSLARQAVQKNPDDWNFRETLALSLIRGGKPDEGERELEKAIALAEKAGRREGSVARFAFDRAWILKERDDDAHLKIALRVLADRRDLTEPQKDEIEELRR